MGINVKKFIAHGGLSLDIALRNGWLAAARYTDLRKVKTVDRLGLLDIHWNRYNFLKHLDAVKKTRPLITVAQDIVCINELDKILEQAKQLAQFSEDVIIVPKDVKLENQIDTLIPKDFILGYSVPTRYGGTAICPTKFNRPVHLLGGRPDVQRELADLMPVMSFDCNRFTLDARYGYYFDGAKFKIHPLGGYANCLLDSIININKIWIGYSAFE